MRSLYATLGVDRGASRKEIKRAYYALAHGCHPDKRPDDAEAAQAFHAISLAYTVLGDAATRRRYDLLGPMALGLSPSMTDLSVFGADAERLGELFSQVVGGVMARIRRNKTKPTSTLQLTVDVATLLRGGVREVRVPRQVVCPTCRARAPGPGAGAGGRALARGCGECGGRGHVVRATPWMLRIPADASPGDVLRMAGASADGRDLHVHLAVTAHPQIRARGLNLYVDLPITPAEAALGGAVPCVLPHRTLQVDISPATQPGALIVLPDHGLRGRNGRGDLHLSVDIEAPVLADAPSLALWQALRAWEQGHPEAFAQRQAHARAMHS